MKYTYTAEIDIPEGWEFVKYDYPKVGDYFLEYTKYSSHVIESRDNCIIKRPILQKKKVLFKDLKVGQKFSFVNCLHYLYGKELLIIDPKFASSSSYYINGTDLHMILHGSIEFFQEVKILE